MKDIKPIQISLNEFEQLLWETFDQTSAEDNKWKSQQVNDIISECKAQGLVSNQVAFLDEQDIEEVVNNLYDNGTPTEEHCRDLTNKLCSVLWYWKWQKYIASNTQAKKQYWEVSCFQNKKQINIINPTFIYCDKEQADIYARIMNLDMILEGGQKKAWACTLVPKQIVDEYVKNHGANLIDGSSGYTVDDEINHMYERGKSYSEEYPEWQKTTMASVLKNLPPRLRGVKTYGK